MSKKSAFAAPRVVLSTFDGHDVIGTNLIITNTGDGLSRAMKVEPHEYHHGEIIHVVAECEVSKIRFDPADDESGDLLRVQIAKAITVAVIDHDLVEAVLFMQKAKEDEYAEKYGVKTSSVPPEIEGQTSLEDELV